MCVCDFDFFFLFLFKLSHPISNFSFIQHIQVIKWDLLQLQISPLPLSLVDRVSGDDLFFIKKKELS